MRGRRQLRGSRRKTPSPSCTIIEPSEGPISRANLRSTCALIAAFVAATGAFALDPGRALTQSRLSVWTNEAGLPQTTINTIVQTTDGYLWMGTEEGLVRFDGV